MKQATNRPAGLIPDPRPLSDDGLIPDLPVVEIGVGGLQRTDSGGRRFWECESA
jgi:hypothetical protein